MEQPVVKNKVGRRLGYKGVNNKTDNPQYFNEYYHKNNHLVKCSCGQDIFSRSLRVHKTSKRHDKLTALLTKKNEGFVKNDLLIMFEEIQKKMATLDTENI